VADIRLGGGIVVTKAMARETFQHVAKVHAARAGLKIAGRQSGGDRSGDEWARAAIELCMDAA
jgi:hypothetical protein